MDTMSPGADTTDVIGSDAHGYHQHVFVRRARRALPYAIAGAVAAVVAAAATRSWIVWRDTGADGSHPPFRLAIVATAFVIGLVFGELMGIALGRVGARDTATRALADRRNPQHGDRRDTHATHHVVKHGVDLSHAGLADRPVAEVHAAHVPALHPLGDTRSSVESLTRVLDRAGVARRGVLCVVSVDDSDTGALAAAGAATSAWLRGVSVAVVDLAGRSPHVHSVYGVNRAPGVSDVFAGELLDLALLPIDGGPVVLTAGGGEPVADASAVDALVAQLRTRHALTVMCARLDDRVGGCAALADACVVAVRVGTSAERLRAAVGALETAGVPVDGIVLVSPERRTSQRRPSPDEGSQGST
ncbi:MAG: hypothetical protein R2743_22490 [Ilumatobacteraceae bacterium]